MKWHPDLTPAPVDFRIKHGDRLLLLGSCFSDHIGEKFSKAFFQTTVNPGGVQYHPLSMHRLMIDAIERRPPDEHAMFKRGEHWVSLDHRGFSAASKQSLSELLLKELDLLRESLLNCQFLFLTFGTAYRYVHLELGREVACNHKLPSTSFRKEWVAPEEMTERYNQLFAALTQLNPEIQIICTVSPVRHLRDGLVENSRSKASLLLLANALAGEKGVSYFPSYELINDDLKEYRFYHQDLAHPNDLAIQYVWEKMSGVYFSGETQKLLKKIDQYNAMEAHRPHFGEAAEVEVLKARMTVIAAEISAHLPWWKPGI